MCDDMNCGIFIGCIGVIGYSFLEILLLKIGFNLTLNLENGELNEVKNKIKIIFAAL